MGYGERRKRPFTRFLLCLEKEMPRYGKLLGLVEHVFGRQGIRVPHHLPPHPMPWTQNNPIRREHPPHHRPKPIVGTKRRRGQPHSHKQMKLGNKDRVASLEGLQTANSDLPDKHRPEESHAKDPVIYQIHAQDLHRTSMLWTRLRPRGRNGNMWAAWLMAKKYYQQQLGTSG